MNVEMSKVKAQETPASMMSKELVEHVADVMMVGGGIESISAIKYVGGFGDRLHVSITQFTEAPYEVRSQGVIIKDAIAQILSVFNISRLSVKMSDEEKTGVVTAWNNAVAAAKAENSEATDVVAAEIKPVQKEEPKQEAQKPTGPQTINVSVE